MRYKLLIEVDPLSKLGQQGWTRMIWTYGTKRQMTRLMAQWLAQGKKAWVESAEPYQP